MLDVQKRLHCNEEITENDVKDAVLLEQFRETKDYRVLEKKGDCWFFGGVLLIIIDFLLRIFDSLPPSLGDLIIMFCGGIVGFGSMFVGMRYQGSVRNKLFQEFKKSYE